MIEHIWSVLCSSSVTDQDTNLVSMFNIIEQLNIQGEPKSDGRLGLGLELVSLWSRSDEDVPNEAISRLSVYSPSEEIVLHHEQKVDLMDHERMRVRTFIQGLTISEPGRYKFIIELESDDENDWREVASIPLKVEFVPEAEKDS